MRLAWLLLAPLLAAAPPAAREYDIEHYRIAIRLDDKSRSFHGETAITLKPLRDGFVQCELDADTFKVLNVHGGGRKLRFVQSPGRLTVWLPRAYQRGERILFTVSYAAQDPRPDPEKYGMPQGYDLGLTFKQGTADHPPLARTLSFPEGARHWFPSNDVPADKATAEILATVRSEWQALANGRLVAVKPEKGWKTFHWLQDKPHSTYLFVLVAGPYVRVSDPAPGPPAAFWVYPGKEEAATQVFGRTRRILRFFEEEYGFPYPWAKYDQIVNPDFGGGMESTTATVIGDRVLRTGNPNSHDWLVAHEAAHQWWGNLVTTKDWSHTWINESFATFGEYLYAVRTLGEEEGALNIMEKRRRYLQEAKTRFTRPIVWDQWKNPNDNFNRHTYEKGAAVLHMLRWILGEKDFRRAISHFLARHAYQPVETSDLLDAIREATGRSMESFFRQWIHTAGHPVFDVRWDWLEDKRQVRLTVAQTRQPYFETPVDVAIVTDAGRKVQRLRVAASASQSFDIASGARPRMVRFDHGDHLLMDLKFDKSLEELLYQLDHDDVTGRIWAASQLKGRGADAALKRAAAADAHGAVRRAAAEALRN